MNETDLAITVYYDDHESPLLLQIIQELDGLGIGYDEWAADEVPAHVQDMLETKAGGTVSLPAVLINDDLLVRPSAANVMSAIMNARTGGFYQ